MMSINYTDWKRDKDCSWANNHALDYSGFYPFQRLHLSTVLHSYRYDRQKKASRVTKFARWLKFFSSIVLPASA